jgi:hypothetical protein
MTPMKKMTALVMLIVSCAILLGGCGGGGGKPLTEAEFIARANAICAPLKKAAAKEIRTVGISSTNKQALSATLRVLPLIYDEVANLKALVPPVAGQKKFDRVIVLSERISSDSTKLLTALRGNDNEAVWNLAKRVSLLSQKRAILFAKLGATGCIPSTKG